MRQENTLKKSFIYSHKLTPNKFIQKNKISKKAGPSKAKVRSYQLNIVESLFIATLNHNIF